MTEPNSSTLQKPDPDEPSTELDTMLQAARLGPQEPPETRGRTTFTDGVVEKIAGIAAREVPGINALGGGFTRTMGAVRDRVPGGHASAGRGVKADVGEKQTGIDLQVVQRDRGSCAPHPPPPGPKGSPRTAAPTPAPTAPARRPVGHARPVASC
jgi:hypothetical protein